MLWGELWVVAILCVGEQRCLDAESLAANLFPAKPADKTEQNQPEREFLENGENPENQPEREILENAENPVICKIRNNKQNCTNPELPKDPTRRKESQKKEKQESKCASKSKSRSKSTQKTCEEARVIWGHEECDQGKQEKRQ